MDALALWQEFLNEDRDAYCAGLTQFRQDLIDQGVRFGDRGLCNHLRPKFLDQREIAELRAVSEAVLEGIMAAKNRMLEDERLLDMLGLTEVEREMVSHDPGFSHIAPCVRLDSFITKSGPQFVELNGECPAGAGYGDLLAKLFLEHPLSKRFQAAMPGQHLDNLPPLLESLLACWAEFDGSRKPVIAIVDYDFVPTRYEFELCRIYFEAEGYTTIVCDPRALDYDGQTLSHKGQQIDLVYKRVLMNEFIEKYEEVKPLYEAYRDGRVCVVNPFRAKIVHKKAVFAVLTDDDRDSWMAPEIAKLIDRALPWTRRVAPAKTQFEGERIDLIPFLQDQRERFVLKPNDDYGGKGIYLGWECDDATWTEALKRAEAADYVVQERLHMIAESFPAMDKELANEDLFVDLDPYMYMGKMAGALARLGVGGLCNVSSGGGQVPLYVLDS